MDNEPRPNRHGKRWSQEDHAQCMELISQGNDRDAIAVILNRTPSAITAYIVMTVIRMMASGVDIDDALSDVHHFVEKEDIEFTMKKAAETKAHVDAQRAARKAEKEALDVERKAEKKTLDAERRVVTTQKQRIADEKKRVAAEKAKQKSDVAVKQIEHLRAKIGDIDEKIESLTQQKLKYGDRIADLLKKVDFETQ